MTDDELKALRGFYLATCQTHPGGPRTMLVMVYGRQVYDGNSASVISLWRNWTFEPIDAGSVHKLAAVLEKLRPLLEYAKDGDDLLLMSFNFSAKDAAECLKLIC